MRDAVYSSAIFRPSFFTGGGGEAEETAVDGVDIAVEDPAYAEAPADEAGSSGRLWDRCRCFRGQCRWIMVV